MRAFAIHGSILAVFALIGVVLFLVEMMTWQSGAFISKYIFTKLYWLALLAYAIISTLLVLLLWLIQRKRNKTFSRFKVVACHITLIGGTWVFIMSGLHDRAQHAWKPSIDIEAHHPQKQSVRSQSITGLPTPPAPSRKLQQYQDAGAVIDVQQQQDK